MAREYGPVRTSLWSSRRFWSLPSDASRLFYMYLLSSPHSNSIGCYRLPRGYIAADLRWDEEAIGTAIKECSDSLLIAYDEAEEVVFIRQFVAKNPTTNAKHALGAVRAALSLPDCELKRFVLSDLARDRFAAGLPELKAIDSEPIGYQESTRTETKPKPIEKPAAADARVPPLARQIEEITGASAATHSNWHFLDSCIARWLASEHTEEDVLAGVRLATDRRAADGEGPPKNPTYFDGPIADARAQRLRPMPEGKSHGRSSPRLDPSTLTEERRRGLVSSVERLEARDRQRLGDGDDGEPRRQSAGGI